VGRRGRAPQGHPARWGAGSGGKKRASPRHPQPQLVTWIYTNKSTREGQIPSAHTLPSAGDTCQGGRRMVREHTKRGWRRRWGEKVG